MGTKRSINTKTGQNQHQPQCRSRSSARAKVLQFFTRFDRMFTLGALPQLPEPCATTHRR